MNPQDTIKQALLKDLGIERLPAEQQQEALAIVAGPIFQAVTLALMEKLPAETHEAFQNALEGGDAPALEALLTAHIPDSDAFMETEVRKAIAEFKSLRG